MSPEDQRIAIAESLGWKRVKAESGLAWGSDADKNKCWMYVHQLPNYLNDLNAMHSVIDALPSDGSWGRFLGHLASITGGLGQRDVTRDMILIQTTAAQRAEAYLRTIGKWKD